MAFENLNIDEIVAEFEGEGMVLVEDQLSDDQCQQALEGIEWAMCNTVGPRELQRQRTYEWFKEFPVFVELIEHPVVIAVAEACLGPEYHLICAEITRNEKDNHYLPVVKKIHQDHCFFPKQPELTDDIYNRMYGFTAQWIILDIPQAMGLTEFILGSHNSRKRYTNEGVTPSLFDLRDFPKRSLVLYDHRTWHRGTDNHTDTPRDLPQNCYALHAVDKVQIQTPLEDGSEVYVPCNELLEQGSDIIRKLLAPL